MRDTGSIHTLIFPVRKRCVLQAVYTMYIIQFFPHKEHNRLTAYLDGKHMTEVPISLHHCSYRAETIVLCACWRGLEGWGWGLGGLG